MGATHGLVVRGRATAARVNANRRDIRFGNIGLPANLFAAGGVRPELSRFQWNPTQAGPTYNGSIRYRDTARVPPQSGGGAGPHLLDPDGLTYLLRAGPFERSLVSQASDTVEPYDVPLTKADFDWLNALAADTELDFAIINTAAWGTRPTEEAFDPIPEVPAADELEGVVAMGLEVRGLGLRYWSLDRDAEIDGRLWVGDSRLSVVICLPC